MRFCLFVVLTLFLLIDFLLLPGVFGEKGTNTFPVVPYVVTVKGKMSEKTLQTRSRSIVTPVQALNDFIFQGLHWSETRLMRIPRTSLSTTLLGLRFTGKSACHGLCKEKPT